jgi:hypothetical protein
LKVVLPVKVVYNQNGFAGPAAGKFNRWAAKSQLAFHVIIRSTASKQCVKDDFEEH